MDTFFYCLTSAGSLYGIIALHTDIFNLKNLANKISSDLVFSPSSLLAEIKDNI